MPPPNPVRSLDNQLNFAQGNGRTIFRDRAVIVDKAASCGGCHTLTASLGEFGTLDVSDLVEAVNDALNGCVE